MIDHLTAILTAWQDLKREMDSFGVQTLHDLVMESAAEGHPVISCDFADKGGILALDRALEEAQQARLVRPVDSYTERFGLLDEGMNYKVPEPGRAFIGGEEVPLRPLEFVAAGQPWPKAVPGWGAYRLDGVPVDEAVRYIQALGRGEEPKPLSCPLSLPGRTPREEVDIQ